MPPQNVLQLSASGSVEVQQDLLVLTLGTSRDGKEAGAVQSQLRQALETLLTLQNTAETSWDEKAYRAAGALK